MRKVTFFAVTTLAFAVSAGDEFRLPDLRSGTEYQSSEPEFHLLGVEEDAEEYRAWVVADPEVVVSQTDVNRIIVAIRKRVSSSGLASRPLALYFYRAVQREPRYPAFRIGD